MPVPQATGFAGDSRSIIFPYSNSFCDRSNIPKSKNASLYVKRRSFFFVILLLVKKPHQPENLTKEADVFHFNRIKATQSQHA